MFTTREEPIIEKNQIEIELNKKDLNNLKVN